MNRDPAFLFYPGDFLVGTMLMTNEEVGKYMRLLCIAHSKGGYLTEEDMFKICDRSDKDIINKFLTDGDGIYYNERLLSEITKRKKYSDSRSNNRKGKNDKKQEHMSNISKSYESHMENENEITNINNNSNTINDNNTVLDEIIDLIETEFKRPLSSTDIEKINYWFDQVGYKYLEHALRETIINRKTSVAYMEAILKDWSKKGITVETLNQGIKSR